MKRNRLVYSLVGGFTGFALLALWHCPCLTAAVEKPVASEEPAALHCGHESAAEAKSEPADKECCGSCQIYKAASLGHSHTFTESRTFSSFLSLKSLSFLAVDPVFGRSRFPVSEPGLWGIDRSPMPGISPERPLFILTRHLLI